MQVPHLSDWIKDLPSYENPAVFADHYHAIGQFVDPNDVVSGRAPLPQLGASSPLLHTPHTRCSAGRRKRLSVSAFAGV